MKTTNYYPVIMTDRVAETAAFYRDHFAFQPAFEADWYVHLQSTEDPSVNLAVLKFDHETVPEAARAPVSGAILTFEVEDVDAVHARLVAGGIRMVSPLKDEAFGQRHFLVRDPAGTLIDVITPIPPSAEFAAHYTDEARPA